tara:strand:- start:224 stop:778 length:555 start_codon:yes stop_codon:yes gene_type:complete
MISKKTSLRSPFPFMRNYAASVRMARCYTEIKMTKILILLLFIAPFSYGNEIDWVKSTVLNDFDSISCEQAKKNIVGILKGSNNIYSQGLMTIKPSLIIWETTDSKIKIVAVTASDSCGLIGCSAVLFSDVAKNCVISNAFNIIQPMESVGFESHSIFINNSEGCNGWKLQDKQLVAFKTSKQC